MDDVGLAEVDEQLESDEVGFLTPSTTDKEALLEEMHPAHVMKEEDEQVEEKLPALQVWWGKFMLEPYNAGVWQIGPTELTIYRLPKEWRIFYKQGNDPLDANCDVQVPADIDIEAMATESLVKRFICNKTQETVRLTPIFADRPMVVRPSVPFSIEPSEEVTLYVSLLMWLRIEVAGINHPLYEFPLYRPSDTWFGESTLEGELCYALATPSKLDVAELPKRAFRAIAPIVIRNRDQDSLVLDRIKIPVQYLGLYLAQDTQELWAQKMILEHYRERAWLRLGWGAPQELEGGSERLMSPREKLPRRFGSGLDIGTFRSFFRNPRGAG